MERIRARVQHAFRMVRYRQPDLCRGECRVDRLALRTALRRRDARLARQDPLDQLGPGDRRRAPCDGIESAAGAGIRAWARCGERHRPAFADHHSRPPRVAPLQRSIHQSQRQAVIGRLGRPGPLTPCAFALRRVAFVTRQRHLQQREAAHNCHVYIGIEFRTSRSRV